MQTQEGMTRLDRPWRRPGALRYALRRLPGLLHPPVSVFEPAPGAEVVQADIALGPSATMFRAGETLRLVLAGRWLWPVNPLTGQFPARFERGRGAGCTVYWGPERPSRLLVPAIP